MNERCLENNIISGTKPGSRQNGRSRTAWMDNVKDWTGVTLVQALQLTDDREKRSMLQPTLGWRIAREGERLIRVGLAGGWLGSVADMAAVERRSMHCWYGEYTTQPPARPFSPAVTSRIHYTQSRFHRIKLVYFRDNVTVDISQSPSAAKWRHHSVNKNMMSWCKTYYSFVGIV